MTQLEICKSVPKRNSKKRKSSDNSTIVKTRASLCDWRSRAFSFMKPDQVEGSVNNICEEVLKYYEEHTNAHTIEQYLYAIKMPESTYRKLRGLYPQLQEAHDMVKMLLAVRREEGALQGSLTPQTVHFVQPYYSQTWRETAEWHAKLKVQAEAAGKSNVEIIEMPQAERTKEVAEKKEADERRLIESRIKNQTG